MCNVINGSRLYFSSRLSFSQGPPLQVLSPPPVWLMCPSIWPSPLTPPISRSSVSCFLPSASTGLILLSGLDFCNISMSTLTYRYLDRRHTGYLGIQSNFGHYYGTALIQILCEQKGPGFCVLCNHYPSKGTFFIVDSSFLVGLGIILYKMYVLWHYDCV